jgi:hypothetical protein
MKDLDWTLMLPPTMLFVWGVVAVVICIYLFDRKNRKDDRQGN